MKRRIGAAVVLALCAGTAFGAEEEEQEEQPAWTASAELGMTSTSGNTEGTSAQGQLEVKHRMEHWTNEYVLSALFKENRVTRADGSEEKERTAERYSGSVQSAYSLEREHDNLFVIGSHTHNRFGAYRRYSTASVGYGTRLLDAEQAQLDVELGPGYFRGEQTLDDDLTQTDSGAMVRAAADFGWQLTESAKFRQTLTVESAQDNTRTQAETSLTTRVSDALQMKVGVQVANDSEVAPDKERTDTLTYVNLVYDFN